MRLTFGKSEKLKSRKQIEHLFIEGDGIKEFPLRLRFLIQKEGKEPFKVGFSVPKRNFKLAVKRNRIKRLIREAYRLNKQIIEGVEESYIMMFIYTGRKEMNYADIEKKMKLLLNRFKENTERTNE